MTDAGGSVVETTDDSPLGVPSAPLSRTPYHFTGEMRDGVGLQTHRARHYAPSLGTWTALDPFEGVMSRPMSLNGYLYVDGDPVNNIDPSGLCAVSDSNCIRAAQKFESDFPGYFIHWPDRSAVVGANSSVPVPSTCPTQTPAPVVTSGPGFPQNFPPKEWTSTEIQTVYAAVQMYVYALTGNLTGGIASETGRLMFVRDSFSQVSEGARTSRNVSYSGTIATVDHTLLLHDTWAQQRDQAYRLWIVIHEMNHARLEETGQYGNLALQSDVEFVKQRIAFTPAPTPLPGVPTPVPPGIQYNLFPYNDALYPTRYAYDNRFEDPGVEYLVEAMTGAIWDVSASPFGVNRTGATTVDLHTYATGSPTGSNPYPANICSITGQTGQVLADFVRDNTFNSNSRIGACN